MADQKSASQIAVITNNEEFQTLCVYLADLVRTPETSKAIDIRDAKRKIGSYIQKSITDILKYQKQDDEEEDPDKIVSKKNKKNIISDDKLMKLLELLMTIDRDLPWEHLF